jgi:hypothetical protein
MGAYVHLTSEFLSVFLLDLFFFVVDVFGTNNRVFSLYSIVDTSGQFFSSLII